MNQIKDLYNVIISYLKEKYPDYNIKIQNNQLETLEENESFGFPSILVKITRTDPISQMGKNIRSIMLLDLQLVLGFIAESSISEEDQLLNNIQLIDDIQNTILKFEFPTSITNVGTLRKIGEDTPFQVGTLYITTLRYSFLHIDINSLTTDKTIPIFPNTKINITNG